MKLHEQVNGIQTRADLIAFVEALGVDLRSNADQWENATLDRYLSALASWLEDMDGYYRNNGLDVPSALSWRNVGELLIAAKMYE